MALIEMNTENQVNSENQFIPLYVTRELLAHININDPFFHSFIKHYINFKSWFKYLQATNKQAWIYTERQKLKAFLLIEEDSSHIPGAVALENKKRLDISKIKIIVNLPVILDLFLKLTIKEALAKNIDEIYYTCFPGAGSTLIPELLNFGFRKTAKKTNNDDIYIKKLTSPPETILPAEIAFYYYPTFYEGIKVKKYILPVSAALHKRLFADANTSQPNLFENAGDVFIEGNTIKKYLLCRDQRISALLPGDILLIYRTQDTRAITSLCTVEQIGPADSCKTKHVLNMEDEANQHPGSSLLLFRWHFHLPVRIDSHFLTTQNIHSGSLSRLTRIDHRKYKTIIQQSQLDETFRVT